MFWLHGSSDEILTEYIVSDHALAARLGGRAPVAQPVLPVGRPPDEPLNGNIVAALAIDLGVAQMAYAVPSNPKKRRADEGSETLRDTTEGSVKGDACLRSESP